MKNEAIVYVSLSIEEFDAAWELFKLGILPVRSWPATFVAWLRGAP